MPTSLASISVSSLTVRFKEPFLSAGLNQKLLTTPHGVHRGFRLSPSITALSIDVLADASGDSLATAHNSTGNAIGIRVIGTTELDLSAKAGKTVVLAIYAQYS